MPDHLPGRPPLGRPGRTRPSPRSNPGAGPSAGPSAGPPTQSKPAAPAPDAVHGLFGRQVTEADRRRLFAQRQWATHLDPEQMVGVANEVRMLRQSMRDAFYIGDHLAVRQCAEALRRLLREQAVVPELAGDEEGGLEDGLSADLRRVLQRVGLEMGIDA